MPTEKEIEAAALAIVNVQREKHGLDVIDWNFAALASWHKVDAEAQAKAALIAAEQVRNSQ